MKVNDKGYSRGLVAVAACLGCAFFGVTMFFWGAMLPSLGQSIDGVHNLPWILTLGIIAGTAVCGMVMDRYGYKSLLICSSLALAAGLCGFIFYQDIVQLTVGAESSSSGLAARIILVSSAFLIGAGGGVLNSETIAIISDIYGDSTRGTMLSILGASYCVGSLLWTVICRLWSYNPMIPMRWSAAVIGLLSLSFIFIRFPKAKLSKDEAFSLIDSVKLFRYHVLAVAGLLFFFQGALEAVSANYSTSFYLSVENGIDIQVALTSLIFMTVGMAVGRFTLPLCLKFGGKRISMFLFMSIAFMGALLQYLMPASQTGAFVSMTLLGFGVGVTAPVVFDYLGQVFKKHSGAAVSLSVVVAQTGMLVGNFLTGKMFQTSGGLSRYFPMVMCAIILVVLSVFPFVARASDTAKRNKLNL